MDRLVGLALAYKAREFSLEEIASETGLGCSTVRAALPRLLAGGLIERNGSRPASYRVRGEALKAGSAVKHAARVAESVPSGVASPPLTFAVEEVGEGAGSYAPRTATEVSESPANIASASSSTSLVFAIEPEKPKRKYTRKRDLVFEALVEFSDADENVDRGKLNTACKKIRGFCEGMTDDEIVAEIAARAPAMRAKAETWPESTLYPHHFSEWWSRIKAKSRSSAQFKCSICTAALPSAQAVAEHVARIHG